MSAGSRLQGYVGTLSEQAVASRQMSFKNRQEEQLVLRDFDRRLSDAVGIVERAVVADADALRGQVDALAAQAETARKALRSIEDTLAEGGDLDAETWLRADRVHDQVAAQLEPLVRRAEGINERLEDPLAYASSLQERFSPLRRPQLLPPESDVSA